MKLKKLLLLTLTIFAVTACNGTNDKGEEAVIETDEQVITEQQTEDEKVTEEVSEQTEAAEESSMVEFTDDLGRTVEIPSKIERLAPSGHLATMMLYSIDPDLFVAVGSRPSEENAKFYTDEYMNLPEVGAFYGKKADLNVEALLSADPQVCIDLGEVKGSPEEMKADLDALQEKVGLPIIFIETELDTMKDAYEKLGSILDQEEKCEKLGNYAQEVVNMAKENSSKIADEDRVSVFMADMESGLATNPQGSIHAEVIDLVGAINVVESDFDSKNDASIEELLNWDPDVVLFAPGSIYSTVKENEQWQSLKAISDDKFYEIPQGPYNWMGRPPAVNRLLGISWLGNLLYPEVYDYDMVEKAQEFYDLFYNYDLSEDEAKDLLSNSTFKDNSN